jgi:hypothetical protein
MGRRGFALFVALYASPLSAADSEQLCPAAQYLPQLTLDTIRDPAVPVLDTWQIFWGDVPVSDAQLAMLAQNDPLIDRTRAEIQARGVYVYLGTLLAAAGTAVSSVGWVLYGQDNQPQGVTLPLGIGGVIMGIVGLLTVTESIQTPLEPHLAPTPVHRLTRTEARELVVQVNRRLYREICEAADAAKSGRSSSDGAPTTRHPPAM